MRTYSHGSAKEPGKLEAIASGDGGKTVEVEWFAQVVADEVLNTP